MTSLRSILLASVVLLGVVGALGCKSGEGEVCFNNGDCSGSLICCKESISATARGRCRPEGVMCGGGTPLDGGPDIDAGSDAGADDAGLDASTDGGDDAGTDGGAGDGGDTDGGEADGGETDGGGTDGGPDGG